MPRAIDLGYIERLLTDVVIHQMVTAVTRVASSSEKEMQAAFRAELGDEARLKVNSRVGEVARTATLVAYADTVESNGHLSYTRRSRFGGGALRRALEAEKFITATAKGVDFGNINLLNRKAKQWARLNFGAGERGQASSNKAVLPGGPRPDFGMPEGVWRSGGKRGRHVPGNLARRGLDPFYPKGGGGQIYPTRGIVARRFFDAGVEAMVLEMRRGYGEQQKQFSDRLQQGIRRASERVNE